MNILRRNGWKTGLIVLISLLVRVTLLQLIPLRSSGTFELPPSIFVQAIGMMPVAAIMLACSYAVIASVLIVAQQYITGGKLKRMLLCSLPYSLIWLMGVLESVSALGKPFLPELAIGLSDIVPLILMGAIVSLWVPGGEKQNLPPAGPSAIPAIPIIAFSYFAGRYFLYAVIRVNSGYLARAADTFYWTLATGLAIGLAYCLLRNGVTGRTPLSKAVWFGGVAFGLYWFLNNMFMPAMFDMSFIPFTPTIMNYVYRIVVDSLFVAIGIYLFEKSSAQQPVHPTLRH
jgi:hypothetical protein